MSIESDLAELAGEMSRYGPVGAGALYEVANEHFGPEHATYNMPTMQLLRICEAVTETKWEGLGEAEEESRR